MSDFHELCWHHNHFLQMVGNKNPVKLEGASQVIKHKGQNEQTHYSPLQRHNKSCSLKVAAHFKEYYLNENLWCIFILSTFVSRKSKRGESVAQREQEAICIKGGSERRKKKSFNKIHSVLVNVSLSTHSATNHTKQNTPVQLLSSRCWDKREEDTQLPPHTAEMITIKLLSNDLKSDKYPQICSSLCEVPLMYSKFRVQIVGILCVASSYVYK